MTDREEFLEIFRTHVTRPGSEKLLDWMDSKTDFFSAPASTRFHGACDGGLCAHSLNVYRVLHGTFFTPDEDSEETFAICALLHDLCKANFYKKGTRNVKNEATGQWEKVPSYSVEDMFPYGHGEKSVFLIERFMKLKVEEAVAIRWHMGGFDDAVRGGSFAMSGAFEKYPLAVKLHIADEAAIGMVNSKTTAVRVIPAIGRKAGEVLDFGGLLGYGPIMPVNQRDPSVFINRGGRLPAPMQSLKN